MGQRMLADLVVDLLVAEVEVDPQAGGPQFQYRARVVTSRELNAFSLPGGFIYVNSGLISAVRSEETGTVVSTTEPYRAATRSRQRGVAPATSLGTVLMV